jgi:hypothetical protein
MDGQTITGLFTRGGTAVGGIFGVAGKSISDLMQAKRDRKTRREQQRSEFQRWQREQVIIAIGKSAESANLYLTKIFGKDIHTAHTDEVIQDASAKLQSNLLSLIAIFPDSDSPIYKEFCEFLDEAMWTAAPKVDPVWKMRQLLIKLSVHFGQNSFPSLVDIDRNTAHEHHSE